MTNLGNLTSMDLPARLYTFPRGNGQALDNSIEWMTMIDSFVVTGV